MTEPDFTLRQGDTVPVVFGNLKDENGDPRPIRGEVVTLVMWPLGGSSDDVLEFVATPDADQESNPGVVSYAWQAGDTDIAGLYAATWRIDAGPDEEHTIDMVKGEDWIGDNSQWFIRIGSQSSFDFTVLQGGRSLGTFSFDQATFITEFGGDEVPHELDDLIAELVPPLGGPSAPNPFMTEAGGPVFAYGLAWEEVNRRPDDLSVLAGRPTSVETFPNDGYLVFEFSPKQAVPTRQLLASSSDLEQRLGVRLSAEEHIRASHLLSIASGLVVAETGQAVTFVEDDELVRPGTSSPRLRLPQRPVAGVSSVKINGREIDADSYFLDEDELVRSPWRPFDRLQGGSWGRESDTLTITYSHGFDVVPEVLKAVCLEAVTRAWTNRGAVQSESHGPVAVSYQPGNGLLLSEEERRTVRKRLRRTVGSVQLR